MLHNIRNTMTPVVNVAENLAGALDELAGLRFRQAADGLADVACPDERRQDLLRYIAAAAERLKEIASRAVDDVDLICQQTSHVEQILASQEEVTRLAPLSEQLDLADIVSGAIEVLPQHALPEIALRVAPELAGMTVAGNRV